MGAHIAKYVAQQGSGLGFVASMLIIHCGIRGSSKTKVSYKKSRHNLCSHCTILKYHIFERPKPWLQEHLEISEQENIVLGKSP